MNQVQSKLVRFLFSLTAIAVAPALFGSAAYGQSAVNNYPSHSIRFVSGFAPGGATDVVARVIGQSIGDSLGQTVVVENKPGAAGNIGANFVAQSASDGYTMYLANATIAMPSLFPELPFDVDKDFAPVSLIGYGPSVLAVNPKLPVRSVSELIAYAKKNPGKLNYASGGVGNITHMAMELFIAKTGVKVVHIPYKGGAPSTNAVVAGEVPVLMASMTSVLGQVKQGTLIPLAVSSHERSPALPNVPTMAEAGVPGYEASSWYGVLVPAKTPKPIIDKLSKAIATGLKQQSVTETLLAQGVAPAKPDQAGPEAFGKYIDSEMDKWAAIISKAHITVK
ncbi:MAG TPA: tripartite tricarboxylate transporter substrate binding protein [Eoetvoesiella sp.]